MSEGISVTMGDIANMENPKKINNAYVQCRDLKFEGSFDVENFENDSTSSLTNRFNKYAVVNLNSFPAGDRLANVKMVESTDPTDNSTKNDLYIIFNNGDKELLETFCGEFWPLGWAMYHAGGTNCGLDVPQELATFVTLVPPLRTPVPVWTR